MSGIISWIVANLAPGGYIVGALVLIDEVLLKIFPSPSQSSIAYRIKEIIELVLKIFPSTKE